MHDHPRAGECLELLRVPHHGESHLAPHGHGKAPTESQHQRGKQHRDRWHGQLHARTQRRPLGIEDGIESLRRRQQRVERHHGVRGEAHGRVEQRIGARGVHGHGRGGLGQLGLCPQGAVGERHELVTHLGEAHGERGVAGVGAAQRGQGFALIVQHVERIAQPAGRGAAHGIALHDGRLAERPVALHERRLPCARQLRREGAQRRVAREDGQHGGGEERVGGAAAPGQRVGQRLAGGGALPFGPGPRGIGTHPLRAQLHRVTRRRQRGDGGGQRAIGLAWQQHEGQQRCDHHEGAGAGNDEAMARRVPCACGQPTGAGGSHGARNEHGGRRIAPAPVVLPITSREPKLT
ncbi:hypothetical protein [Gemmatimonas sp.]|uniref:hypothetical protein n=1 Tax=Gemmatimonas sp. TaxID=1962908 RepID=UPI00391F9C3D